MYISIIIVALGLLFMWAYYNDFWNLFNKNKPIYLKTNQWLDITPKPKSIDDVIEEVRQFSFWNEFECLNNKYANKFESSTVVFASTYDCTTLEAFLMKNKLYPSRLKPMYESYNKITDEYMSSFINLLQAKKIDVKKYCMENGENSNLYCDAVEYISNTYQLSTPNWTIQWKYKHATFEQINTAWESIAHIIVKDSYQMEQLRQTVNEANDLLHTMKYVLNVHEYQSVDSTTQLKSFNYEKWLYGFLEDNNLNIKEMLNNISYNEHLKDYIEQLFDKFKTVDSFHEDFGIDYYCRCKFNEHVENAKMRTIWYIKNAFNCTITVRYDSPGGRNHYEQSKSFSLNECIAIYDKFSLSNSHNKNSFAYQQRKAMSNALRFDVMKRDGFKCQLCGRTQKDGVTLEVDHVFPVAKGGLTVMSNLQTLCKDCNRGKGTKSIN